jgi:hypothetical protein
MKVTVKRLLLSWLTVFSFQSFAADVPCQASCPNGGEFFVDLQARCMCIKGHDCFKINIGKSGPNMTTGGVGKTHPAEGSKYQTKSGPGNTGYDNDAIATGIQGNDAVGKWIHKAGGCIADGSQVTKGCIAVPCDKWPAIKQEMGQSVVVCGSTTSGTSGTYMKGYGGGESDYEGGQGNR